MSRQSARLGRPVEDLPGAVFHDPDAEPVDVPPSCCAWRSTSSEHTPARGEVEDALGAPRACRRLLAAWRTGSWQTPLLGWRSTRAARRADGTDDRSVRPRGPGQISSPVSSRPVPCTRARSARPLRRRVLRLVGGRPTWLGAHAPGSAPARRPSPSCPPTAHSRRRPALRAALGLTASAAPLRPRSNARRVDEVRPALYRREERLVAHPRGLRVRGTCIETGVAAASMACRSAREAPPDSTRVAGRSEVMFSEWAITRIWKARARWMTSGDGPTPHHPQSSP